jgi:hypothetical protein
MFFDHDKEIVRREAGESGFCEMGIGGEEILRSGVNIGEIAATAAGNKDFFADAIRKFNYGNMTATIASFERSKEASGTSAEN